MPTLVVRSPTVYVVGDITSYTVTYSSSYYIVLHLPPYVQASIQVRCAMKHQAVSTFNSIVFERSSFRVNASHIISRFSNTAIRLNHPTHSKRTGANTTQLNTKAHLTFSGTPRSIRAIKEHGLKTRVRRVNRSNTLIFILINISRRNNTINQVFRHINSSINR